MSGLNNYYVAGVSETVIAGLLHRHRQLPCAIVLLAADSQNGESGNHGTEITLNFLIFTSASRNSCMSSCKVPVIAA